MKMKSLAFWENITHYTIGKVGGVSNYTKDTDFSDMIMLNNPPPRIIHIKLGNMKMRQFHQQTSKIWDDVCLMSEKFGSLEQSSDGLKKPVRYQRPNRFSTTYFRTTKNLN